MAIKILIVSSSGFYSTYGGGQVYVKNIVDEMIRQQLDIVIASPGTKTEKATSYKGVDVFTFANEIITDNLDQLKIFIANIKPDVVHAHGYKAAFAKACNQLGIPCVVTAHHGGILCPAGALLNHKDKICTIKANAKDCLPCVLKSVREGMHAWSFLKLFSEKNQILIGRFLNKLPFLYYITPVGTAALSIFDKKREWQSIYENSTLLIAPSKAIAASMILNGASSKKIQLVPHGIPLPPDTESTILKAKDEEKSPLKFFFVGRICHVKGVHIMLEAFNQINSNAELHLIGGTGNRTEERYSSKLQRKYQENKKIIWHGKIPANQVNNIIAPFDVMIHPAIFLEVFGLTISEALALGKPVIATKCGGAEMQIQEKENGILVAPNDVQSLKLGLMTIIEEKQLFNVNKLGFNAVHSIREHIVELAAIYQSQVQKFTN
jgi:glycosyltransferase involved in cell wall biosynthesis